MLCPYCNTEIPPVKNGTDRFNGVQRYACRVCGRGFSENHKPRAKPKNVTATLKACHQCGTETTNPRFCSSSCAAKYNNHVYPKRAKRNQPKFCKKCSKPIEGRRVVCADCNPNLIDWSQRTIADIHRVAKYQVSSHIRERARRTYSKSGLPYTCRNCGYDKHVEICHIKAIKDYPVDTLVSAVNDISNLVALCPNCHWELDHGLLKL